jgi:predicted Fe-Mo cluster-binding NifX family protein
VISPHLEPAKKSVTRIAVCTENGELADYRSFCSTFDLIRIEANGSRVLERVTTRPPTRDLHALAAWLASHQPDVVALDAVTMAERTAFAVHGIQIVVPATEDSPQAIARGIVEGTLATV